MSDFKIPATIEDAVKGLNGIEALLTAKEWERAAIVYTFTEEPKQGRRSDLTSRNSTKLTCAQFAELGVVGLSYDKTVSSTHKSFAEQVALGTVDKPEPGKLIDLSRLPKWQTAMSGGHSHERQLGDALNSDSPIETKAEAFAKFVTSKPQMKDILQTVFADDLAEAKSAGKIEGLQTAKKDSDRALANERAASLARLAGVQKSAEENEKKLKMQAQIDANKAKQDAERKRLADLRAQREADAKAYQAQRAEDERIRKEKEKADKAEAKRKADEDLKKRLDDMQKKMEQYKIELQNRMSEEASDPRVANLLVLMGGILEEIEGGTDPFTDDQWTLFCFLDDRIRAAMPQPENSVDWDAEFAKIV